MNRIKKQNSIAKSAILVTLMMLCFKGIGFVKQAVIAYFFGATSATDSYFIAWGFVSGISEAVVKALLVSVVAIYTELRVQKGKEQAAKLINGLLEILIPIFIIIVAFIFLAAPLFSIFLAPSFSGEEKSNLILFIRILSPILLFGCLELVFGAVLDSYKSFFVPRLQSFIYSISVIMACFFLSRLWGIRALIFAQFFSSISFSFLLIFVVKKYHSFSLVKYKDIPELKNILVTAIPLFIGNSALQINQMVDKSITSGIGEGAVSALSYCHTLEQFVTNIMIVNIGNVMFANFAEFVAEEKYDSVRETLAKTINILIALLAGISVITIVCAKEIVSLVYYRGSFDTDAVILTATALIGYAFSFVAVAVRDLSVKSLYAFKDTKHPMMASIVSICINIVFSLLLSKYIGILGVSIATSISAIVGMIMNAFYFKKHLPEYRYDKHIMTFIKCIPGVIVLLCLCLSVKEWFFDNSLARFLFVTIVGLPIYFIVLWLSKVDEIKGLFDTIVHRFQQKK